MDTSYPLSLRAPVNRLRALSALPAMASSIPERFTMLAESVVAEHDLQQPTGEQLRLIVREALQAQIHFHAACMEEPNTLHLDAFLMQFILNAISTASICC
jgi:hypothetical protein